MRHPPPNYEDLKQRSRWLAAWNRELARRAEHVIELLEAYERQVERLKQMQHRYEEHK